MKVTTERLENSQVRIVVELDAAEAEDKLRQAAQRLTRKYPIPGYRKGKAPYTAVLRMFGRDVLQEQALDEYGQELYDQALEQVEYEPYDVGRLEKVEWEPFRMEILLPIRPEIDLGDYRAVRVEAEAEAVTDEQIDQYLEDLRRKHTQSVPVDRPAQFGDRVVLDIESKVNGQVVLGNQGREMILMADSRFPTPGFHDQVVGMSVGEEKTFVLPYPEDDPRPDVAGRDATFDVRLIAANEEDVPELGDELAMTVGDYDTLDALRAAVRQDLENQAQERAAASYPDRVLDKIVEGAPKIEFPDRAVEKEVDIMLHQMEDNLGSRGVQLDTYLGMIGKTRSAYRQELRSTAEGRVRRLLALGEIIADEGLTVGMDEVQAEIDQLAASAEFQDEEMQKMLASADGRSSVLNNLLLRKANERLAQIGRGEAPPLEASEAAAEQPAPDETMPEAAEAAAEQSASDEPEPAPASEAVPAAGNLAEE